MPEKAPEKAPEKLPKKVPETLRVAADLAALIAPNVGNEKASSAVDAAVRKLGYQATGLNQDQALSVLETIAQEPGLVGIAARFAKSRLHLS